MIRTLVLVLAALVMGVVSLIAFVIDLVFTLAMTIVLVVLTALTAGTIRRTYRNGSVQA